MKRTIIKTLLSAILLLASASAFAGPALRIKKVITLADGTKKTVFLCGDENLHFYMDAEGNSYATDENNKFVKSDKKKIKALWAERSAARNNHRLERAKKLGLIDDSLRPTALNNRSKVMHKSKWGATTNPTFGSKKGLVILVNFADKKFGSGHDQQYFNGYFNEVGFSKDGMKGSVHDYFYESSYGQFDLTFDVIGPVTVSKNMAYYGKNMYGADMYAAEMVTEACLLADNLGVDFSKYDWDKDGNVDQVFILYAGYGENMGGAENTIWPHESTLTDALPFNDGNGPIALDGVQVDTYAASCELFGGSGNQPAGIGTACHEFSHCMCIPDMYDIYSQYMGMYAWDLMDYGAYGGESYGDCPAPFTSYERMYCGWLTPKELSTPTIIQDMPSIHDAPEAYIIYNENNRNEYYLLENRQQKGFSAYDYAHGLLVLHVDFDESSWVNNMVNSTATQRMTIIPADNRFDEQTIAGDTYPGTSNNTALTDDSKPAATLNTANKDGRKYMGKPIDDITEVDGKISFVFDGGITLPTPSVNGATDITDNGFTAHWSRIDEATEYEIRLNYSDKEEKKYDVKEFCTLAEDFHGFNNGGTSNGTIDISKNIDDYTGVKGWEGKSIYTTPRDEIRIGSQMSGGYIVSPWLGTESKVVTVTFTIRSYSNDQEPVYLVMGEGDEGEAVASFDLEKNAHRWVITASSDTNEWWFGLSCEARCYVSEMSAYEGYITEEEMEEGYKVFKNEGSKIVTAKDNSYKFEDLDSNQIYSYSVRTVQGKSHSPWSDSVEVSLTPSTAIDQIPEDIRHNAYYDLQGRPLMSIPTHRMYIHNGKVIYAK